MVYSRLAELSHHNKIYCKLKYIGLPGTFGKHYEFVENHNVFNIIYQKSQKSIDKGEESAYTNTQIKQFNNI